MIPANTQSQASVLVVEDNVDLNAAVCEILESYGYRTSSATDGFAALEELEKQIPDVILCDIMMPGMDGYTLLQHTRADQALRTLPFIFLTALTSTEDQKRAKGIGIEDYLTKPIDESHLITAIQNALRRRMLMEEETQRQMDSLRSEIVGLLQHEFRTPLTFILGYAEYIQETSEDNINIDDLRTSAGAILKGGHRLQKMIETFLLLADLQRRELSSDNAHVRNGVSLWREVSEHFRRKLKETGLEVVHSTENQFATVVCDSELLAEALRRLMDNAIRYRRSESRQIWVSITDEQPYIGFCIRDESQGIPATTLAKISRPFEQADRDNRSEPGAGLSLTLVQHIARLHGGILTVSSEADVGTVATLWIPSATETIDPS